MKVSKTMAPEPPALITMIDRNYVKLQEGVKLVQNGISSSCVVFLNTHTIRSKIGQGPKKS